MSENPVRSASEEAAKELAKNCTQCSHVLRAAPVVAAAEGAMKEKCCKIMCWMCARGTPTHIDEYGNTIHEESTGWERCKAGAIRFIPTGTALAELQAEERAIAEELRKEKP